MPHTAVISCDAKLAIKRVYEWPSLIRTSQNKGWRHQNKLSIHIRTAGAGTLKIISCTPLLASATLHFKTKNLSENKIFFPQMTVSWPELRSLLVDNCSWFKNVVNNWFLGSYQCIPHKHGNRHRTHSTWHWGDVASNLTHSWGKPSVSNYDT